MFKINKSSGYFVTFDNDWTLSVQWGPNTYSSNRAHPSGPDYEATSRKAGEKGSGTAEIAAWHGSASNEWLEWGNHDAVSGWVTPDTIAKVMFYLSIGAPSAAVAAVTGQEPDNANALQMSTQSHDT